VSCGDVDSCQDDPQYKVMKYLVFGTILQPIPADMRLRISNAEFRNLDSVNHCTSKEMPNLDSVNLCTSKTESRFGISKFGIPIEIRSLMSAGIGCK